MYAEDFQSNFPDDIYSIYPSYVPTANYFFCPGTPDTKNIKIITKENSHISYKYISGLTRNSASELLLLYDRENNHKGEGRNVLSVDGTTEWIPEDNWPAVWKMHTEKPALDTDTIGDKTI